MTDVHAQAVDYLRTPADAFWRWEEAGEVVAWVDGVTILFRPELRAVLQRLAPRGLPPLGSVLLLMSATRGWNTQNRLDVLLCAPALDGDTIDMRPGSPLQLVLQELERLAAFAPDLLNSTAARAELADLVFHAGSDKLKPEAAAEVVRLLEHALPEEVLTPEEQPRDVYSSRPLYWDCAHLLVSVRAVDEEALRLRLRTGLEAVPGRAEVELPPAQQVRGLLSRWLADEELGGVARLARQVLAALAVPRPLSVPDEIPDGGLSDLSNRGPLDRLLLSELAHDNLTLAARVANGEALYLRREQPAVPPPRRRVVVLEAGLRSWGVPRVFATAVALALVAATDRGTKEVRVVRAEGPRLVPVDLLGREGVLRHLEALQPEAHPGKALPALKAMLAEGDLDPEAFLVTTDDAAADIDFQRDLARAAPGPLLLATVNREGEFVLRGPGGRPISRARLDLKTLYPPEKAKTPLVEPHRSGDFPAICSVYPFPLRLPAAPDPVNCWPVHGLGAVMATGDRRLLLWRSCDEAAEQLADNLPPGRIQWCSRQLLDNAVVAVIGEPTKDPLHRVVIPLDGGRCESTPLRGVPDTWRGVCHHNGWLFVVGQDIVIFSTQRTTPEGRWERPPWEWRQGRFFARDNKREWGVLSYDGNSPVIEPIEIRNKDIELAWLAECPGIEGYIGVTSTGMLYSPATDELLHGVVPPGCSGSDYTTVPLTGELLVDFDDYDTSGFEHYVFSVESSSFTPLDYPVGGRYRRLGLPLQFQPIAKLDRIGHVAISAEFTLVLVDQSPLEIRYNTQDRTVCLAPPRKEDMFLRELAFEPGEAPPDVGYTLKVARTPAGHQIYLDSRGLLHLRSADPTFPEITLVLFEGEVAGWTSRGALWGNPAFTGRPRSPVGIDAFYHTFLRPFVWQLL